MVFSESNTPLPTTARGCAARFQANTVVVFFNNYFLNDFKNRHLLVKEQGPKGLKK